MYYMLVRLSVCLNHIKGTIIIIIIIIIIIRANKNTQRLWLYRQAHIQLIGCLPD